MEFIENYDCLGGMPLSALQKEVFILAAKGVPKVEIAKQHNQTNDTVRNTLDIVYKKLYSTDILEATLKGVQAKQISPKEILENLPDTEEDYMQRLSLLPDSPFKVFEQLGYGLGNTEIAKALNCSEQTIKNHITTIRNRVGITCRTQIGLLSALLFEPESLLDAPEAQ